MSVVLMCKGVSIRWRVPYVSVTNSICTDFSSAVMLNDCNCDYCSVQPPHFLKVGGHMGRKLHTFCTFRLLGWFPGIHIGLTECI